jgi:hypothetical protein
MIRFETKRADLPFFNPYRSFHIPFIEAGS